MLTLATLLSHHVSLYRSQRQERAPWSVVESLPWVQWGIDPLTSQNSENDTTRRQKLRQSVSSTESSSSNGQGSENDRDLEEAPPRNAIMQARWTNVWLWSHRLRQWATFRRNVKPGSALVRAHNSCQVHGAEPSTEYRFPPTPAS